MKTQLLKQTRDIIEHNIRLYELQLATNYFLVEQAKEAVQEAIKMNKACVMLINQELEAIRMGIKFN